MESSQTENPRSQSSARTRFMIWVAYAINVFLIITPIAIVVMTRYQMVRSLPESRNFQPGPAVLAIINERKNVNPSYRTMAMTLLKTKDRSTTSASARQIGTTAPTQSNPSMELFPEKDFERPELRAQARRINESFHQWAERLVIYERNPKQFVESPRHIKPPFGKYVVKDYDVLASQLASTALGSACQKKLMDACLQLLVHYGEWEAASAICNQYSQFYTWEETLYCLRPLRKPLIKYPRIVVWSALRMVDKLVARPERQAPEHGVHD